MTDIQMNQDIYIQTLITVDLCLLYIVWSFKREDIWLVRLVIYIYIERERERERDAHLVNMKITTFSSSLLIILLMIIILFQYISLSNQTATTTFDLYGDDSPFAVKSGNILEIISPEKTF